MESLIQPHEKRYIQKDRHFRYIHSKTQTLDPHGKVTAKVHLGLKESGAEEMFLINPTETEDLGGSDYKLIWKT